jgi:hypothetical protein
MGKRRRGKPDNTGLYEKLGLIQKGDTANKPRMIAVTTARSKIAKWFEDSGLADEDIDEALHWPPGRAALCRRGEVSVSRAEVGVLQETLQILEGDSENFRGAFNLINRHIGTARGFESP